LQWFYFAEPIANLWLYEPHLQRCIPFRYGDNRKHAHTADAPTYFLMALRIVALLTNTSELLLDCILLLSFDN